MKQLNQKAKCPGTVDSTPCVNGVFVFLLYVRSCGTTTPPWVFSSMSSLFKGGHFISAISLHDSLHMNTQ